MAGTPECLPSIHQEWFSSQNRKTTRGGTHLYSQHLEVEAEGEEEAAVLAGIKAF